MRFYIKTPTKIGVNRGQVHFIIKRQKHEGHNKVANKKANNEHVIFKTTERIIARSHFPDSSRHRNKRHAAQTRPDHPEGNQPPFTFFVSDEKRLIIGIPTRNIGDHQKPDKIGENK